MPGEARDHDSFPHCERCIQTVGGVASIGNTGIELDSQAVRASIDMRTTRPDFVDPLKQKQSQPVVRNGIADSVVQSSSQATEAQRAAERNRNALKEVEGGAVEEAEEEDDHMDFGSAPSAAPPPKRGSKFVPPKKVSIVGGAICSKCGLTVGYAEKMVSVGGVWHKGTCFACHKCDKKFATTGEALAGGQPPLPTCANCHSKFYGKKVGI